MKISLPCLIYCTAILGWPTPSISAAVGGNRNLVLQHNPFQHPQQVSSPIANRALPRAHSSKRDPSPPRLNLRATLLSNRIPMINVDGSVLAIGDEIEGYRLTNITEGEATFTRGKRRLTLSIGKKDPEQDQ